MQTNVKSIAQKSLSYGMPGIQVDGNDLFAMYAVVNEAIERARSGGGPSLIEAYTYRLGAHTTADDPSVYRDEEEVVEWRKKDPIDRLRKYLYQKSLWDDEKEVAYRKDRESYVKETFKKVENSGLVSLEDVFDYIYEKRTPILEEAYQEIKARNKEV
jgi:pyruvate dehydrogenase E1 component alpha subunit